MRERERPRSSGFYCSLCYNYSTSLLLLFFLLSHRGHFEHSTLSWVCAGRKNVVDMGCGFPTASGFHWGSWNVSPRIRGTTVILLWFRTDMVCRCNHFKRPIRRRESHSCCRAAGTTCLSKVSSPRRHLPLHHAPCATSQYFIEKNHARSSRAVPCPGTAGRGQRPERGQRQRPSALSRARAPKKHPLVCSARPRDTTVFLC